MNSSAKFDLNIPTMHPFKKSHISQQQARTPCKSIHNQLGTSSQRQRPHSSTSLSKAHCSRQHSIHDPSKDQCSFAPQIKQIPFPLYPSQWQNLLKSKKEHWEQLTKDNRQRNYLRAEQKVIQEDEKLRSFTFSPLQSKKAQQESTSQIFNRLFGQAQRRKNQQIVREKLALEKQEQQLAAQKHNKCKNAYKLNSQKYDLNPLYLRLEKVVQQQMQHKKMIAQKEQPCSFKPTIDPKSAQLAKKDRINNIVDRLLTDHKNRQVKINQLRQQLSQELENTLTFKPSINDYMPTQPPSKSIIVSQPQIYPHRPQINLVSAIMTRDRQYQSTQQQLHRLHSAPINRRAQKRMIIAEEMYAECSFNPQINQLSKEMTGTSGKTHCCATPVKVAPTYRPKINEISKTMSSTKRAQSLDNIKRKKKEKALAYLNEAQYDELKQCTFRPKTLSRQDSKLSSTQASIDQIAGFSKFKSNIQKALEKQRIKKQLQEKLFHLEKSYDQRMLKKSKGGSQLQNVVC